MERSENNFYFKREKGLCFFNNPSGVWIYEVFGTRNKGENWAYIAAGVAAAVLNYYVFAVLYLSFRYYNIVSLSFFFGMAAVFGSLFLFLLFLRNFFLVKSFFLWDIRKEKVLLGAKKGLFSVFNSNYSLTAGDGKPAGLINRKGLFSFSLFVYDAAGEALFRMDRKKGIYYFYGVSGLAVGFAKKSSTGTYSIDLNRDLNGLISEKLCAAAIYLTDNLQLKP